MLFITKYHIAYAYRKSATPEYIFKTVDYLRDAERIAREILCDDDDSRIWIEVNNKWYCVFGRDIATGRLIVSEGVINIENAYVSDWY